MSFASLLMGVLIVESENEILCGLLDILMGPACDRDNGFAFDLYFGINRTMQLEIFFSLVFTSNLA